MRTIATFESTAFNTSESREYFINSRCFGDDVASWLSGRLRARGLRADPKPIQEDFGWTFTFDVPTGKFQCIVGFRAEDPPEPPVWILWVQP
jgi:hypothetical protein